MRATERDAGPTRSAELHGAPVVSPGGNPPAARNMVAERLNPVALTPPVPWEFRELVDPCPGNAEVAGVDGTGGVQPVGRPGKVGVLDLSVGLASGPGGGSGSGTTCVTSRFVKAPMQFTRPLHIDPGDLGQAFLYLRSTGGGLAQNDRIRQWVRFGPGARAAVTTTAGTAVHRMNAGLATQWVSLEVGEGAVCEYLPGQVILFAGSRLLQVTEVVLAESATLLAADVMLSGRLARGERDRFDALGQCWRIERSGRPLLSDTLCVFGPDQGHSEMLLARWPVWGTVLLVPPVDQAGAGVRDLVGGIRDMVAGIVGDTPGELLAAVRDLVAVASTMVGDTGVLVRVAGEDPVSVRSVVDAVYDLARRRLLGRPAVDLRRM